VLSLRRLHLVRAAMLAWLFTSVSACVAKPIIEEEYSRFDEPIVFAGVTPLEGPIEVKVLLTNGNWQTLATTERDYFWGNSDTMAWYYWQADVSVAEQVTASGQRRFARSNGWATFQVRQQDFSFYTFDDEGQNAVDCVRNTPGTYAQRAAACQSQESPNLRIKFPQCGGANEPCCTAGRACMTGSTCASERKCRSLHP
jgi:hypothetical protein